MATNFLEDAMGLPVRGVWLFVAMAGLNAEAEEISSREEAGGSDSIVLSRAEFRDPAHFNIRPAEGEPMRHTGHVMLQAVFRSGQDDSDRLYADGTATGRSKQHRYAASGQVERRPAPELGATTAWRADGNFDRFLNNVPFAYVRGWLEHNERRNIDQLAVLGAGLGAQLIDAPNHDFSVRAGLEHVSLDRVEGTDANFPGLGWGVNWMYVPESSTVEWFHNQIGVLSRKRENVALRSRTGVRILILGGLRGVAQVNIDWDKGSERSSTETTLILGLGYNWGTTPGRGQR